MGMAASQARYLGLTARKTNVEYEGQQVNQARTALANQSANTFNDLLALEVPTAPSTQDYTTLQYSYQDGLVTETITDMSELINDPDGYNYLITHYHYSDIFTGIRTKLENPQVVLEDNLVKQEVSIEDGLNGEKITVTKDENGTIYSINGHQLKEYNPEAENADEKVTDAFNKLKEKYPDLSEDSTYYMIQDGDQVYFFDEETLKSLSSKSEEEGDSDSDVDSKLTYYTFEPGIPKYVGNCAVSKYDPNDTNQKSAYEQLCKDLPDESIASADESEIYVWTSQGRTYFATYDDLVRTAGSASDPSKPTENQNKLTEYYAENVSTKIERQERAFVDLDEKGRPQSIRFEDSTATYALSTETKTDEAAYEDAMNRYHYDMQVYEKKIADINAKTEKIQEQDRTLELRLRQLDTEQEALQTEMEAVKKVIDKNIESTFKTFE